MKGIATSDNAMSSSDQESNVKCYSNGQPRAFKESKSYMVFNLGVLQLTTLTKKYMNFPVIRHHS